ncbi:hypothetical protein OIO90_004028 [Microbotryomycetes sp. JL221]|nr:hypothetical protein OIO90_004028 [Microbotryomycetes sp. JL221]
MAPRFYVSPYKNALGQVPKKDAWWSELPVSSAATTDSSDLIKSTSECWLAQGSQAGTLVCLPYDGQGKFGFKARTIQVAPSALSTFDVSRFDDLVASGTQSGKLTIVEVPTMTNPNAPEASSPSTLFTSTFATGKAIDNVVFHPTSSGLVAASSAETVAVFDVEGSPTDPAYSSTLPKPAWSLQWSSDGRILSTTAKDNILRLWDVRASSQKAEQQIGIHGGIKASRHVWLGNAASHQVLTTGFSKMREREYSLYDTRNPGIAVKTQRVDNNMGVLMPVVDSDRNIVYFAGRGDMTLKWTEIGGPSTFTEGSAPLPVPISSIALAPPAVLDLMKAEINRVMVLTSEAVLAVPIEVPRRQYIDFHSDLYPTTWARVPNQNASAWRAGQDAVPESLIQIPGQKPAVWSRESAAQGPATTGSVPVKEEESMESATDTKSVMPHPTATVESAPLPTPDTPARAAPRPSASGAGKATNGAPSEPICHSSVSQATSRPVFGHSKASAAPQIANSNDAASAPNRNATVSAADTAQQPAEHHVMLPESQSVSQSNAVNSADVPQANKPSERYNSAWSRKFLAGKTPLKPDYHDVHGLSATMSPDVEMFKANRLYFFFPLGGPGGRLAVHAVAARGRLPADIPALVCGATIMSFELDPFVQSRVFVACDDSKVRMFELPTSGNPEGDLGGPKLVFGDSKMDRINVVSHHPCAKGLLTTVSDDHGKPTVRLWDTESGALLHDFNLPSSGTITSAAWSPDGSRLALASKKKQILLLDPRDPSSVAQCPSHDSLRPVHLTWISDKFILSSGFSRAASRELIIYEVNSSQLKVVLQQSLDVSPAPLFPYCDLDTNILLLYSRGERTCQAYEVTHDDSKNKTSLTKLPNFEHGTLQSGFAFLPKTGNDIKGIEIISSYRLTQSTIERVSFTVPRAKAEYFQDDIFVPTRDVETPSLSANEWIQGKNEPLKLVELRPSDMKPLSQAPRAAPKVSTRDKIGEPVMTESQKQDAYMDRLFKAAKDEGDDEEVVRNHHAPVDDDDW